MHFISIWLDEGIGYEDENWHKMEPLLNLLFFYYNPAKF